MKKVIIFSAILALFLSLNYRIEAQLTRDYFPLMKGAQWTYSLSPSTLNLAVQGYNATVTLSNITVSIPSDNTRRTALNFSGTITVDAIYAFSGNIQVDEAYEINNGTVQLIGESLSMSMQVPALGESATGSGTGTFTNPIPLFREGMIPGDSLSFNTVETVDISVTIYEPGKQPVTILEPDQYPVSGTVTVLAEEDVVFNNSVLSTIPIQMTMNAGGSQEDSTLSLSPFVGPVKIAGVVKGLDNFFYQYSQLAYQFTSTNLPIWENQTIFAIDSANGGTSIYNIAWRTVQVDIPAGSLSNSCNLIIAENSNIPTSSSINGLVWAIGIDLDDPNTMVNQNVITITLPFDQNDLNNAGVNDPQDLVIYKWSSPATGWQALQTTAGQNTVSAEVTSFSIFGLGAPAPGVGGGGGGGGGGGCFISTINRIK